MIAPRSSSLKCAVETTATMKIGFHTDAFNSAYWSFDKCLAWAQQNAVVLIPCGGATSVAGHLMPPTGDRPCLTLDMRRMNALHVGSITNTGQVLKESVGLTECINKVDAEMRKHNPNPFQPATDPFNPNLVRVWGFASAYKNTGLGGGAGATPAISCGIITFSSAENSRSR